MKGNKLFWWCPTKYIYMCVCDCVCVCVYVCILYLYFQCPLPSRELPSRGWSWQRHLQNNLFQHSLVACSIPRLSTLPLQYLSILLIHFTSLPPDTLSFNPTLIYFLHKVILFHSHHISKPSQSTMLYSFSHSTIHSFCCYTHTKPLIHASIAFFTPIWHNTMNILYISFPPRIFMIDTHLTPHHHPNSHSALRSCTQRHSHSCNRNSKSTLDSDGLSPVFLFPSDLAITFSVKYLFVEHLDIYFCSWLVRNIDKWGVWKQCGFLF